MISECESCSKEYEKISNRQKYCNDCRHEMGLKMSRAWKEKAPVELICPVCGNTFIKQNNNKTCSPECQIERTRLRQLERNEEAKAERSGRKIYKRRTEKKEKVIGIEGKMATARAMGITYADLQKRDSLSRVSPIDVTLGGRL